MPIEILMPALSPTMTEGTLAKWLKKEGDAISPGDVIAEIETDKATMEVEAVDDGTLGKILVAAGSEGVPVNKPIALLLADGEDKSALKEYKPAEPEPVEEESQPSESSSEEEKTDAPVSSAPQPLTIQESRAPTPPQPARNADRSKASPVARRLAEQKAINLNALHGTGPGGRIVKADVEEAIMRGGTQGAVHRDASEFIHVPNSTMRKTIAKRLLEAKQQIPHFYLTVDCELDSLLEARKHLNGRAAAEAGDDKPAYKLSVNDFIIKAVAMGLKKVPAANASWYDDAIVQYTNVDVSVAVATEGGLITPIIKNTDQKTLPQIANEMKALATRAREGTLMPEEYQGGGFSISNLGMYGISEFAAVINPPQSCILAVGKGEQRAVVRSNGQIEAATMMTVTLSCDHRAVDGAVGATFLTAFKDYIEQPVTMLV